MFAKQNKVILSNRRIFRNNHPLNLPEIINQAIDNISEIVFITDVSNHIIYANKSFNHSFQYNAAEILGKHVNYILSEKNDKDINNSFDNSTYFGGNYQEIICTKKNGEEFRISLKKSVIKDDNGNFTGYLNVATDLSEIYNIKEELAIKSAEVHGLYKSNRSIYFRIDSKGTVLDYIADFHNELYLPARSVIGKNIQEVLPLEISTKVVSIIAKTIKSHSLRTIEIPFIKNKTEKIYEARVFELTNRQITIILQDITERVKTEESLKKSESQFRLVWEKSIDGMRLLDSEGNMIAVNNSFCRMMGGKPEDFIGKKYYEVYRNDDVDVDQLLKSYIKKFQKRNFDEFIITKQKLNNGKMVYLEVSNNFIDSYDGELDLFNGETLFFSIFRDISERKMAEEFLREREELYRNLIETSPDAIALLDLEGNIITVNQQAAEMFGFVNNKEMMTSVKNSFDLFSPKDRIKAYENAGKTIEYGNLKNVEYILLKSNGSHFYGEVSTSVLSDKENKPYAFIHVIRDITERKISGERIKRSEEHFRSIWENSNDGMRLTDCNGIMVAVNKAFCKIVGIDEKELIGRILFDIYQFKNSGEYDKKLNSYNNRFIKRNFKPEFNSLHFLRNGKQIVFDADFSFIDTESDNPLLLSILRDVTEQTKIETELHKSEKLAAIGKMALYLAHEIKTPLTSIKMNIDILLQSLLINAIQQKSFSIIQKEIKRLEKLLKEVLQFSKSTDLKMNVVNLTTLFNNINEILSVILNDRNIKLIINLNNEHLEADYQKLLSAFIQIIENSIEAVNNNGTIEICSGYSDTSDSIKILLKDSGCGIEEKERIFEPFYTTKSSGTGLGLSIAKNIIEQHNGSMKLLTSIPGETIFEINLLSGKKNGQDSCY